ncbi:hypothetical protein GGX14DRAFT_402235 [Mycena pura]|uniref:Transcription factor domain-containing protein n=1 Tax=Mycena pura TaxID=153505 RepID=A0AAD6UZ68_9AGAR|nr:hypothetical protein GGX14DRAFT_402235 [Mycena pura]
MSTNPMANKNTPGRSLERLRRGKACLNCRHLKIRPMCGPCNRLPKDDPCEYPDSMSRTQELQETIVRLQSRVDDLQGTAGPSDFAGPSAYQSARISPGLSSRSSESSMLEFQEPPLAMIQMLHTLTGSIGSLHAFLPHATQFGFFLHPQRFRDSALLPLPSGDVRRPSAALLCVVYLWGVRLAQAQPLLASEPIFLRRAQHQIATDISGPPHAHVLHTIQAQVLLATYLFRDQRLLEAEVHANGAATFALRHGLHRVRSSRPSAPALQLPPPADAVEEGERIRSFWAVATLQSHLCTALNGTTAAFCVLEGPAAEIDTPWPLEVEDYAAGMMAPGYRGQESIRFFMTDDPLPLSPVYMLHAKAAVLLYRAARLTAGWSPQLSPQQTAAYIVAHTHLEQRVTKLWQSLPPVHAAHGDGDGDGAAARARVLVHAVTASAAIRLNCASTSAGNDRTARAKRIAAARAVVAALGDARVPHRATAHPVLGSLGAAACTTLMDDLVRARAARASWTAGMGLGASLPPPGLEETAMLADLRTGMAAMQVYAAESTLIGYQLQKIRQQYEAISGSNTLTPSETPEMFMWTVLAVIGIQTGNLDTACFLTNKYLVEIVHLNHVWAECIAACMREPVREVTLSPQPDEIDEEGACIAAVD